MWLVGGIYGYGYNVWVWLVGVVMRYIDILIIIINFTYSTCIRSFFGSSILTSLFIFKCFFGLVYIILESLIMDPLRIGHLPSNGQALKHQLIFSMHFIE